MLLLFTLAACTKDEGADDSQVVTDDSEVNADDSAVDSDVPEPEDAGDDFAVYQAGAIQVWLNNGDAFAEEPLEQEVGATDDWVALADFDGDGLDEIWQAKDEGGKISIYMNQGDRTWEIEPSFEPTSGAGKKRPLLAGDFDGDGRDDVGFFNTDTGRFIVYPNSVGQFEGDKITTDTALGKTGSYTSGDFDGDGTDDLLHLSGSDLRAYAIVAGKVSDTPLFELNLPGTVWAFGLDIEDDGDHELVTWHGSSMTIYRNEDGVFDTSAGEKISVGVSGVPLAGQVR